MDNIRNMRQRQMMIKKKIEESPYITDEELASLLGVSIHTIRADRKKIGIPEVRKRTRDMVMTMYGQAKTLSSQEIIGELLEVDLDIEGLSLLDTSDEMGMEKTGIVRGHMLFAQANSLANAIVDADVALTVEAHTIFSAPVLVGERILAKARVVKSEGKRKEVEVILKTKKSLVFKGIFKIRCLSAKTANRLKLMKQGNTKED